MKKRIIVFFIILICLILIPILIFPRNSSIEDAQYDLALELFKKKQYKDAVQEFNRLLYTMKTKKYKDSCYYYIGNAYYYMKDYKNATANFKTVVDKFKTSMYYSNCLYLLGRCELLQSNFNESVRIFNTYVKKYPANDYADNSLYWKAEALLSLGKKENAKSVFNEVLNRYPYGNKADAARFKLRLLELEEKIVVKEEKPLEGIDEYLNQIKSMKEKEMNYIDEINKLNNQIDYLKTEINNLKAISRETGEEQEKEIQEKIMALISWQNILGIKEKALNKKEEELNIEYERIMSIKRELEGNGNE